MPRGPAVPAGIARGTPEFRRTIVAMSSAGFATFTLMYCVQPLLPNFAREFGVSAATSSLALSLTTGCLAASMLVVSVASESLGRRRFMIGSMLFSGTLTLVSAFVTSWPMLLAMRALVGIAFGGLPALAMAYLGEEMEDAALAPAMALYVAATGVGGMSGRLLTAVLADLVSWRFAIGATGALGVVAAVLFWRLLPPSRRFTPVAGTGRAHLARFGEHLRDGAMVRLFAVGFAALGTIAVIFNYVGFRLMGPPYDMSQTGVGMLFLLYLTGVWSSGRAASLIARRGRPVVLRASMALVIVGAALTIAGPLPLIVAGIALCTVGFFAVHSVASGWVAVRAQRGRAQGTALYLAFYYLGSSVAGWLGGVFWDRAGWIGVTGFVVALMGTSLAIAWPLTAAGHPMGIVERGMPSA